MNTQIRRKLQMATRVRDFSRAHPHDNPGYTAAVERLEERVARAEALAQQERTGRLTVTAAVASKTELRNAIRHQLRLLVGLAGPAAAEEPAVIAELSLPRTEVNHQAFLTSARVAVAQGTAHRELLVKYGMPETVLEELTQALDRFEQALNEKHAGATAHVGARADLDAVTEEIMRIIRQLDALNRYRFRADAEQLAAWKSARDIAWPMREREPAQPVDGAAPSTGNDSVAPAA